MIPHVFENFIGELTQKTESGGVVWSEGEYDSYVCDHKEYTLYIKRFFDEKSNLDYISFRFIKAARSTPFNVSEDESDFRVMRRLYEAVIANANAVASDLKNFFS